MVEELVEVESLGEFTLKGFLRPVVAYNVLRLVEHAQSEAASQRQEVQP